MSILVNTGFEVGSAEPLDKSSIKETVADRDALVTAGLVYEGMKVYCKDTRLEYRYNGTGWDEIGSGTGSSDDTEVRALIDTNKTNIETNATKITELTTTIGTETMDTTATDITGAIKEVNGNLLGDVTFSADYKNIVLNRKNGTNPYTIPISAIINHANLIELADIDTTDIGDGKTIVYDTTTQKHKYVSSTGTDELVKMDTTADAHYLVDLIDKQTVVNENGILKVKMLDGQDVTITEINFLKGLTMNVMDLVNAFANGGVKVINTPLNTASELSTMDRSTFIDGISYIVYVLADENHTGAKTTYLVDKTNTTFFGNADSQRDFVTNPIDLANEVTGKLGTANIDIDSLWSLLTIDDTYKTLTTTNNAFSTHGAKAMYDELVAGIGAKANQTDFDTHKDDTTIHISSDERTKWNDTAAKVDGAELVKKADIKTTTLNESSTNDEIYGGKAIFDAIKKNCVGKETVLFKGKITATGTYNLTDNVNNYDVIVIGHAGIHGENIQSNVLSKIEILRCIDDSNRFNCNHGNGDYVIYVEGYFNNNKVVISTYKNEVITSIIGYKFGQVTVQNTIANPSPAASYSIDEQLTGGTWIDGKPIYRKVIEFSTSILNAGENYVSHGLQNIELIMVNKDWSFLLNDDPQGRRTIWQFGNSLNLNDSTISEYSCNIVWVSASTISIYIGSKLNPKKVIITFEYTKTTDV